MNIMRIFIAIIADIFIAIIALFAASEYFGIRRYNSFTVPYTDKLISLGVIEADKRETVLREDRISTSPAWALRRWSVC